MFSDLGRDNADTLQCKALLAAEIVNVLDRDQLSVREARSRTRIAAADFSLMRSADLESFAVDRLSSVLDRLGSRVEVRIRVRKIVAEGRVSA